jgi:hypothetical protein
MIKSNPSDEPPPAGILYVSLPIVIVNQLVPSLVPLIAVISLVNANVPVASGNLIV